MDNSLSVLIQKKLMEAGLDVSAGIGFTRIGGGSINQTYRLASGNRQFFCKVNSATKFPHLFSKEKDGLKFIARQGIIKTPRVIDSFEAGTRQVLLLEWINSGDKNKRFWEKFGEQLAALHQVSASHFGLEQNNYMGSVEQLNGPSSNWIDFFVTHRLQRMIDLCLERNLLSTKHRHMFERLYIMLPKIFDDVQKPALVHGDLWNGNFMCSENGEPVLIDPAVYFGHPAVDLGMTTLFGGFAQEFYKAYAYHAPLPSGFQQQWQITNLYPLLIHLHLFGRTYLPQIESTLQQFA